MPPPSPRTLPPINCTHCKESFEPRWKHQKYCSPVCSQLYWKERSGRSLNAGLPSGTVGTIAEMMVASDLFLRGYSVFRALSPHCFCDLIAHRGSSSLRVEVRTGYVSTTDNVYFPTLRHGVIDCYAVYINNGKEVRYFKPNRRKEPFAI
jgi:hypothetical protein